MTPSGGVGGKEGRVDAARSRVAWVDIAKGWCIVLVVMMHSAIGVGLAIGDTGWLHSVVAFARPFRMPDFFLVAGLFASRAIELPWRVFLDRRVIHFLYFYALWVLITLLAKAGVLEIATPASFLKAYLWSFVEPFSSMWFIYILPFLFLAARLTRTIPRGMVLAAAFVLHVAAATFPDDNIYAMGSFMSGWTVLDSFTLYLLFFLVGHFQRDRIFRFAARVALRPGLSLGGLAAWALFNFAGVASGFERIPGLTVIFGLSGAYAVVALSSLLSATRWMRGLAYCGRHSLVIYLAFVLPMGAARVVALKSGVISSIGWLSLFVTVVAITVPLLVEAMTRDTILGFLFRRPQWARLPAGERHGFAN